MLFTSQRVLAVVTLLLTAAAGAFASDQWPRFRGPTANAAVGDNPRLPERWSETENVEWVADIPGLGWSSPVVWGDLVFLTSAVSEGEYEAPKPGLYAPRGRSEPPQVQHDWRVYCLDLKTGDVLWQRSVHQGVPEFPRHQKHTYAAETPATDGERVYVRFGDLGLFTFDLEGNELWRKMTPHRKTMSDWGSASSPVVYGDYVIVVSDTEEESWIAALDKRTGEEAWRVERDEPTTWATPFVWEYEQRTEIVVPGRTRIRSYDLEGSVLWELDGKMSWATIAAPFASHGMVFVTSGYFQDQHRPVYAIRAGASGDISLAEGETSNQSIAWYLPKAGNYNTSPLVYRDVYYSLLDRGFFEAYDVRTGEPLYGRQRIAPRGGASFTASPWAYNGKVFALSEQGDTFVIKAGPAFEVLAVNSLDEMAMASPAIVGDRLLLRTRSKLYSIGQGAGAEQGTGGAAGTSAAPGATSQQVAFAPLGVTGHSWGAWVTPGSKVEDWIDRARNLCAGETLCQINVFAGPELATHEDPVPEANREALAFVVTYQHEATPRIVVEEAAAAPGRQKRTWMFEN